MIGSRHRARTIERSKKMWKSEIVKKWHKGAIRPMMQAVCTECDHHGVVAGWLNVTALTPCKCGK